MGSYLKLLVKCRRCISNNSSLNSFLQSEDTSLMGLIFGLRLISLSLKSFSKAAMNRFSSLMGQQCEQLLHLAVLS